MDEGSGSTFSQYVRQVRPELRRRAFRLCGDWYEADDLVQQTLIKMFRHWHALDHRGELSAYSRTVLVRTFLNEHRAPWKAREFLVDRLPEPDPEPDDQELLHDRFVLLDALARLGRRQRAVIVLRYWEHLSVEETADTLGCSTATVRSQSFRGLANLRSLLRYDHGQSDQM